MPLLIFGHKFPIITKYRKTSTASYQQKRLINLAEFQSVKFTACNAIFIVLRVSRIIQRSTQKANIRYFTFPRNIIRTSSSFLRNLAIKLSR